MAFIQHMWAEVRGRGRETGWNSSGDGRQNGCDLKCFHRGFSLSDQNSFFADPDPAFKINKWILTCSQN